MTTFVYRNYFQSKKMTVKKPRIALSLLFLFALSWNVIANIRNFTYKDGLSNGSIMYIFQDSRQRMWFGTWDGLNMYNAYEFKRWKAELHNPESLYSNVVLQISEDSEKMLWISTEFNISKFDEQTNTFDEYPVTNTIFTIGESDEIVTYSKDFTGLFYYNKQKDEFEKIKNQSIDQINALELFFSSGFLWIQTEKKDLLRITYSIRDNSEFIIEEIKEIFPPETIFTISCYEDEIWIVDMKGWICSYNQKTGESCKLYNVYEDLNFESSEFQDDTHLVVDVKNGIIYVNSKLGGVHKLSYSKDKILSHEIILKEYKVSAMEIGSQDILWVGTDGRGILMVAPEIYTFSNWDNNQYGNTDQAVIRAFHKDAEGSLWIGTKGAGIFYIPSFENITTQNYLKPYPINTTNGLINDMVYVLYEDQDGNILIGSDGKGVSIYNTKEKKLYFIHANDPAINDEEFKYVYSIYQDKEGVYWFGTNRSGLIRLVLEKQGSQYKVISYKRYSSKNLLTNNNIIAIVPENDSILWLGTKGGGINRINTKREVCEYIISDPEDATTLSNNSVLCLYRDKEDTFWVGTFIGLNRAYKTESGKYAFEYYTEKEGLLDNTVKSITQDNSGDLWITTNSGLNRLNKEKNTILSFDYRNGVMENEFAENAVYIDKETDYLFFGGNKGFTCFNAKDIQPYNYQGLILFDELRVQNENVNIFSFLNEGILSLKYNQNFFTLYYNSIDYIRGDSQEYLYKLEHFNQDWIDNGNSHSANFTNVPPGDYIFKIKCKSLNPDSEEMIFSLPIHISKPWWKHTLAYTFYILFFIFIAFAGFRFYSTRLKEKNALLIEKMNRKKEEDIHESKLRFFTNIAHELTTPLTLINGRCEKILSMQRVDSTVERYVGIIRSNAIRMNSLIKQIMEFRKVETGNLKLYAEDVNVVMMLSSILKDFQDIAKENKIEIRFRHEPKEIIFPTDRESLTKIFYNLISNAIKYTPYFGLIDVKIERIADQLHIEIQNTGQGIKPEDLQYVFDRFRILDNYEKNIIKALPSRNGIGLSLCHSLVIQLKGTIDVASEYGKNTTFSIQLPELPLSKSQEDNSKRVTFRDNDYFEAVIKDEFMETSSNPDITQELNISDNLPSILVVDDNPEILSLICDTLKGKYNFTLSSNGFNALELIKLKTPDLAIVDIMMPGMNGYELTEAIKGDKLLSHIPVIMLSSKVTVEEQIDGFSSGADAYISKPFNLKHLEILVDRLLENKAKLEVYYNSPTNKVQYVEGKVMDKDSKDFLNKLNGIIESNLDNENLNPDFLSMELMISRIQLYRKLKDLTGKSPSEYIRNIRFIHCSKLLLTTNKTVQEIMYETGFSNKGSFYKEFTKLYKCSPKQYRNQNNKALLNLIE